MMTTCAREGSSGICRDLLDPGLPTRVMQMFRQAIEMFLSVTMEIEIQLGDANLHQAPQGFPKIRNDARHFQAGPIHWSGRFKIAIQQALVVLIAKFMVDREVRQIEERI